jgi:hypothetical protein
MEVERMKKTFFSLLLVAFLSFGLTLEAYASPSIISGKTDFDKFFATKSFYTNDGVIIVDTNSYDDTPYYNYNDYQLCVSNERYGSPIVCKYVNKDSNGKWIRNWFYLDDGAGTYYLQFYDDSPDYDGNYQHVRFYGYDY